MTHWLGSTLDDFFWCRTAGSRTFNQNWDLSALSIFDKSEGPFPFLFLIFYAIAGPFLSWQFGNRGSDRKVRGLLVKSSSVRAELRPREQKPLFGCCSSGMAWKSRESLSFQKTKGPQPGAVIAASSWPFTPFRCLRFLRSQSATVVCNRPLSMSQCHVIACTMHYKFAFGASHIHV